jgi:endonuclease/exonuclease/phosphatase (EEP) superfamily protein YafD
VLARARAPGGAEVAVACLHCQNGPPAVVAAELERAAAFLAEAAPPPLPLIVAGDLNSRLDDPRVVGVLERAGLAGARGGGAADRPLGVDHILHRGLEVVAPPRRWAEAEREVTVPWRGGRRLVRLSDHDPVEAVYRLPERVTGS